MSVYQLKTLNTTGLVAERGGEEGEGRGRERKVKID